MIEEGNAKFAKSIYDSITKIYSGVGIELSEDSDISDEEGNPAPEYVFEKIKGREIVFVLVLTMKGIPGIYHFRKWIV